MPRPDFEVGDVIYLDQGYAFMWFGGFTGPYRVDYVVADIEPDSYWYIGFTMLNGDLYKEACHEESYGSRYCRAPERYVRKDVFLSAAKKAIADANVKAWRCGAPREAIC